LLRLLGCLRLRGNARSSSLELIEFALGHADLTLGQHLGIHARRVEVDPIVVGLAGLIGHDRLTADGADAAHLLHVEGRQAAGDA